MNRVKQTRESIIRMNDRHFTAPVDEISGTVYELSLIHILGLAGWFSDPFCYSADSLVGVVENAALVVE